MLAVLACPCSGGRQPGPGSHSDLGNFLDRSLWGSIFLASRSCAPGQEVWRPGTAGDGFPLAKAP